MEAGERVRSRRGSEKERAFEHRDAFSAEHDAVAGEAAVEASAAAAGLIGGEAVAAQPLGPPGHRDAMGGAGHRILVYSSPGREDPADDVGVATWRGADGQDVADPGERGKVRPQREDLFLVVERDQRVAQWVPEGRLAVHAERGEHLRQ